MVKDVMRALDITRMPKSIEVKQHGIAGLESAIYKFGGYEQLAKSMGLENAKTQIRLTDFQVELAIHECVEEYSLESMPSSTKIIEFCKGKEYLHNRICRSGGYRFWADKLKLPYNESETKLGQDIEFVAQSQLESMGYTVEQMSTGHPYDILVNGYIKVDVKAGKAYDLRGSRCHTFGINKEHASCDIYMIYALSEDGQKERVFIIPSHKLKLQTLSIGAKSKYDPYLSNWELFKIYDDFYKTI